MPVSPYILQLRKQIGNQLLLLPAVTAVIRSADGRFLLCRHLHNGKWSIVGGGVEPFELPREALVREVKEETGLDATILHVLDTYGGEVLRAVYANGDVVSYVTTAYLCSVAGEPVVGDTTELSEVRWFSRDEIRELDRTPWMDAVLDDAERLFPLGTNSSP